MIPRVRNAGCHDSRVNDVQVLYYALLTVVRSAMCALQHTGTSNITGFAHVPEAGALCVSDASGRLLMIDTETRAIEEVRGNLHQKV